MEDSSEYSFSPAASVIVLAFFFVVGWLGSVGFTHRDAILAVFVESHLNKYQVMAEEIGDCVCFCFVNQYRVSG